jgi:hypothetical protein
MKLSVNLIPEMKNYLSTVPMLNQYPGRLGETFRTQLACMKAYRFHTMEWKLPNDVTTLTEAWCWQEIDIMVGYFFLVH